MNHAKYQFPIDVVKKEQLEKAGIRTVSDVLLYEVHPIPSQNPILDEHNNETGLTLHDYEQVT
jgi:hypothetical protein